MYKSITIFTACISLLSCKKDDFLDITPKGLIIPTRTEDYRLMLDQVDSKETANGFFNCIDDDTYLSDELKITDNPALVGITRYAILDINNFLFKDNSILLPNSNDLDWNRMFNQIYLCNVVIKGLTTVEGSATEKAKLDAEARVHRAYAYLLLVNMYAKHYDPVKSASDLGLPLLTDVVLQGSLKRASVQKTYEFILADLSQHIIDALPNLPEKIIRPSKAAAYAILARTQLYMGNFDKALEAADKSLALNNTLLNLLTLPPTPLVAAYPNLVDFPSYFQNPEILLLKGRRSVGLRPQELSDKFLALFDINNDIRYRGVFATDFVPPRKIITAFDMQLENIRLTGPSVAEMMLTKAECLARAGNITEAIDLVNALRTKRIKIPVNIAYPASALGALEIVKNEREREFILKGMRWFDLKRYNAYDNANFTLVKTYKGETVTLAPGDNRWVRPINRKLHDLNNELELNPQ